MFCNFSEWNCYNSYIMCIECVDVNEYIFFEFVYCGYFNSFFVYFVCYGGFVCYWLLGFWGFYVLIGVFFVLFGNEFFYFDFDSYFC